MPKLTTASVGLAVTPTIINTLISHYLNRKPLRKQPTAHLSYHEGLCLIRSFLEYASHHTVDDIQAFTSQWVPHPAWVRVNVVTIPDDDLARAARALESQLGPDGIRRLGGRRWWQWREPDTCLEAEWVEMYTDYSERIKTDHCGRRVMLYVHGGAYYFGSVDEHRFMLQRHARKLKARVFAPRYRLAPQFPFPCSLHDCLAAYLYLLASQDPATIVLAGDSAGAGIVLSMLVTIRDRGLPLPAGAVLISPWCDLTHSFPSVSADNPLDYVPPCGFHHRPSRAWPPPDEQLRAELQARAAGARGGGTEEASDSISAKNAASAGTHAPPGAATRSTERVSPLPLSETTAPPETSSQGASGNKILNSARFLTVSIDGEPVVVKDQIQLYTTNDMLSHPLVSPIMQPTLGGLPPLLIIVGGGEMLRDEQIYLAHKCADPQRYPPPEPLLDQAGRAQIERYTPTSVQVQVWDNLCHVAPTLSFTRPAKYIYRSIAQFGAWALARAQKRGIDILADDAISVISSSNSELGNLPGDGPPRQRGGNKTKAPRRGKGANTGEGNEAAEGGTGSEEGANVEAGNDSGSGGGHKGGSGGKGSNQDTNLEMGRPNQEKSPGPKEAHLKVGKAGDSLPRFKDHMIRQRVTRHGVIYDLEEASRLAGCTMPREEIGIIRGDIAKKWLARRAAWDKTFAKDRAKIETQIMEEIASGLLQSFDGEQPPPSSLAGRWKKIQSEPRHLKRTRGLGMALWALWGSKHDEMTVKREIKADKEADLYFSEEQDGPDAAAGAPVGVTDGQSPRSPRSARSARSPRSPRPEAVTRIKSRMRTVVDDDQANHTPPVISLPDPEPGPAADTGEEAPGHDHMAIQKPQLLSPDISPAKGVTGKRVFIEGVAMPFSLGDKADSASMVTLLSNADTDRAASPIPPLPASESADPAVENVGRAGKGIMEDGGAAEDQGRRGEVMEDHGRHGDSGRPGTAD